MTKSLMKPEEIKILVVDDEKGFRQPMEFWLKSHGYNVTDCESGEEALTLIKNERPTIVFLDLIMPQRLDGLETLQRIREIDKELPVILITAYGTDQSITEAIKLGIDGFFPKEESFNRLAILINTVLNRLKKA